MLNRGIDGGPDSAMDAGIEAVARFSSWVTRFAGPYSLRYGVWDDAPMAVDEIDEEAARLTVEFAALKIEHARLSATLNLQ